MWKIVLTTIVTVLFFAAFTAIGTAAIIYVPDDYGTIQGAVDAAGPGDTIIVRDGTYTDKCKCEQEPDDPLREWFRFYYCSGIKYRRSCL